jgi:ribosome-binding protein aMBF1 (putative translation factor)
VDTEKNDCCFMDMGDPEFARIYARESVVEDFLDKVDQFMQDRGISRAELARKVGCTPATIMRIMQRTQELTVEKMSDIAYELGLNLQINLTNFSVTK